MRRSLQLISPEHSSMKSAEDWLTAWTDGGRMHAAMWKAKPGGQAMRKNFVCSAHEGCEVVAVVRKQGTAFGVFCEPSREHSTVDNYKKRKNSALTVSQEAQATHECARKHMQCA